MQGKTSKKPVVKITVGGPRFWGRVFFTYLLTLPGVFQKLGTSEDPEKLRAGMQRTFKGALILTEARAFRDRGEAMEYESRVHAKYRRHRIVPPHRFANPRSTKFYSPGAEIHL
jgi:hypothetical protein